MDQFEGVIDNPATQAAVEALLNETEEGPKAPKPLIRTPSDGTVRLQAGLARSDGRVVLDAEVQELTGEHEERLAKVRSSQDPTRWYNTLLRSGTVSIGGDPATEADLGELLVGDREILLLAIRENTYGPEVEVGDMYCPECRIDFPASLSISDIPVRPFDGERDFKVKLRKGGIAWVRLPSGSDQTAYMEDPSLTDSERNSILLSRVVLSVTVDGDDVPVAGFPSVVRELGIVDRRNILDEIDKRTPGPRYDEVEIEHECGTKIQVPMGLVPLFPGL